MEENIIQRVDFHNTDRGIIGIIIATNKKSKKTYQYIGIALGENMEEDMTHIIENGIKISL